MKRERHQPHLSILMVNEDIPSAVVLQIGYLQAVGSADFRRLESGVQRMYLHYGFRLSGLQKGKTFLEKRWSTVYFTLLIFFSKCRNRKVQHIS